MSKNLTRKGIAFGALIALGTTLIAGAPAQAAQVSVAPSAGTGNATILGEYFTVKATLDSLVPSSANATLKFKVTNADGASLTYKAQNNGGTAANNETDVDADGGTSNTGASTGTSDVVYDTEGTAASTATLAIKTSATVATTVSVVAFLDADGAGDLDSGEYQTAPYEVKFVKAADAALTVAWSGQLLDDAVSATVKSTVVNVGQFAADAVQVKFGKYVAGVKKSIQEATGSAATDTYTTADADNTISAALNADEDALVITNDTLHGDFDDMSAGAYLARAVYFDGTNYTNAGAEISFSLGASEAVAAAGKTEYEIVASENVTSAGIVRSAYKGDVVYQVTVKDTDKKALAGKTVRLTTDSSKTGTFTVNGVTAAVSTSYDATTNASGVATFTIKSSTATSSDAFNVATIVADGVDLSTITDLAWDAASYTVYEKASRADGEVNRGVSGSSTTVTYVVLDQWKKALTGSEFRIKATLAGSTVAVINDTLADGSATLSIADGGLDTSGLATTVDPIFEELVSGTWTSTESSIAAVSDPADLTINWYASQTDKITFTGITSAGAETASQDTSDLSVSISANKTVSVDTNLSNTPVFAPPAANAGRILIDGVVSNAATSAVKKGALVTVSGDSSILFRVGTTWSHGSLTFNADSVGHFAIEAFSNKSQADSVVTVTSNGVSKTAKVTFVGTNAVGDVVAVTTDAPAYLAPGRSAAFKFTAVDKYGNAVLLSGGTDDLVSITLTGAGYLTSYPTVFTKGVASLVLITQPNDTGAANIKAVASLNASTDITTTATVQIGSAPVAGASAAIAGSTKRFYVSVDGNTSAKNVVVKVAGKTFKTLKGSTAKKTYTVAAPKGSHKVTVYVGGKLIATKTISVK